MDRIRPRLKRWKWFLAILVMVMVMVLVGWTIFMAQTSRLSRELIFLEAEYAELLSFIEEAAKDENLAVADAERQLQFYEEVASKMPEELVYMAIWSLDGHHGLKRLAIERDVQGYKSHGWPVSRRNNLELRVGRSFEGGELVILKGRVPGGVKGVYEIAFYRRAIPPGLE